MRHSALALITLLSATTLTTADEIQFNRDIRPILVETCFQCHGPDSATRAADLRLDIRDEAVNEGALVPGDAESSEVIARVFSEDEETLMPPQSSHKELTQEQKELLKRWVDEGAQYEPHWSFINPTRPQTPEVALKDWVRNPIDAFILEKLQEKGLKPADPADKRTLVRRVCLDLTGLPPEPELVEKFVSNPSENAYEELVDELLSRPTWGEHRGRYWLDYARYADTHGIHFDNYREMWSYRDWVIDAFNQNMPYDKFTVEQLAGDLLEKPSMEQLIASGFNRCNITTNEGGIIDEEYAVLYTRDRTETYGQVFLGLTTGCAVCHDHKFDPLSQKEFYELSAFFNNTTQPVRDGNKPDTPPIIVVPTDDDRERWGTIDTEIASAKSNVQKSFKAGTDNFKKLLEQGDFADRLAQDMNDQLLFHVPLNDRQLIATAEDAIDFSGDKETVTQSFTKGVITDRAWTTKGSSELPGFRDAGNFKHDQAFSYGCWVKVNGQRGGAIFSRMANSPPHRGWDLWLEESRVASHIIQDWPSKALKVATKSPLKSNEWTHVFVTYDGSRKPAGLKIYFDGVEQPLTTTANSLTETDSIQTDKPLRIGHRSGIGLTDEIAISDIRIYEGALTPERLRQMKFAGRFNYLTSRTDGNIDEKDRKSLQGDWMELFDEDHRKLMQEQRDLEAVKEDIKTRGTIAHVMHEKDSEAMAYILARGEYDKRNGEVHPKTPEILHTFSDDLPKNRLGLAKWTIMQENPLTARVAVNRFWQEIFGNGLVATSGDFGITGELPSHPHLLDWLAVEFRDSGWDIKKMYKLMVMSNAYRQSSLTTPEKLEIDPANRFLSRGPRFRMDGEMVRDTALAASGLLVNKMGGPSVKPYQPPNIWEVVGMAGSTTRNYQQDHGDNLYRRSVYTFWKRFAPPPSLEIFNAPNRENCTVRRERTNTPLQALVTLNDTQFVEAARHLAEEGLKQSSGEFDVQLDFITDRLISRRFNEDEHQIAKESFEGLKAYYEANPTQAEELLAVGEYQSSPDLNKTDLAAWTMLTNELMNLDEVLCK